MKRFLSRRLRWSLGKLRVLSGKEVCEIRNSFKLWIHRSSEARKSHRDAEKIAYGHDYDSCSGSPWDPDGHIAVHYSAVRFASECLWILTLLQYTGEANDHLIADHLVINHLFPLVPFFWLPITVHWSLVTCFSRPSTLVTHVGLRSNRQPIKFPLIFLEKA